MRDGELGGFRRDSDSFEGSEIPPPLPNGSDDWFYVDNGEKIGPISALAIKSLLNRQKISSDAYVWRKGMREWAAIRDSELYGFIETVPPPLSAELIDNSVVWIIAFMPLITLGIDLFLTSNDARPLQWYHLAMLNIPFLGWDTRKLNRAGYNSNWIFGAGLIFVPVYLFARAKLLRQFPWYGIVWIVCFLVSLIPDSA